MENKTSDSRKSYIVTKLAIEGAFCKHILLETRNINEPLKREHIQLTFDCKKMQSMVLILLFFWVERGLTLFRQQNSMAQWFANPLLTDTGFSPYISIPQPSNVDINVIKAAFSFRIFHNFCHFSIISDLCLEKNRQICLRKIRVYKLGVFAKSSCRN